MTGDTPFAMEVQSQHQPLDERFPFGENWRRFLNYLKPERLANAEKSLKEMLESQDLKDKSFVDVGCGSGLFSLAAMRLGAERVYSFDFDPQSVACARELKRRYFDGAANWIIQQGSALDPAFLASLGQFDIVYSWGVLHHTGNMWRALENIVPLVGDRGKLFVALYNDQAVFSDAWKVVKRLYNRGWLWRALIFAIFVPYFSARGFVKDVLILHRNPFIRYKRFEDSRGMAYTTDLLDWLGGYPFEVARIDEVFDFYKVRGFSLVKLKSAGIGLGNNEFVFVRD